MLRIILCSQGLYFLVTGLWPLFHMRSFLAVTGPKTDLWLVRMVGALISVSGVVLLIPVIWRDMIHPLVIILAAGNAIAFIAIDLIYYFKGVISKVYILDALVEGFFVLFWFVFYLSYIF